MYNKFTYAVIAFKEKTYLYWFRKFYFSVFKINSTLFSTVSRGTSMRV